MALTEEQKDHWAYQTQTAREYVKLGLCCLEIDPETVVAVNSEWEAYTLRMLQAETAERNACDTISEYATNLEAAQVEVARLARLVSQPPSVRICPLCNKPHGDGHDETITLLFDGLGWAHKSCYEMSHAAARERELVDLRADLVRLEPYRKIAEWVGLHQLNRIVELIGVAKEPTAADGQERLL